MTELQKTILELIARGVSLRETAVRLCEEVERLSPGVVCTVVSVEDGYLRALAAPSLPDSYAQALDGLKIGPDVGTCGAAAYWGEQVTVEDIATDPRWEGFRHLALPFGLAASWSFPIFDSTGAVGATFGFYYRERRGPSPLDRAIVDCCVNLCSIALDRHRRVLDHERRATTDVLTGLPNRAAFNAALERLSCCEPGSWALCMADLDNLKVVNDTYGHQAGDSLLKHAAERLRAVALPDRAFRIGGDEFAVIIAAPESLRDLDATVAGYLEALGEPAADCEGHLVRPRATIGMAVIAAGDGSAEQVRQNADFALYHAKETGRGGYVRYWPGIGTRMTRRLNAIREVDAALREDRIEAHYQPVIRLGTAEIVGLEALCRMRLDDKLVSAASFHEATTDVHIATQLTEQMMGLVAADLRKWIDMGIPFQHVGINVSSGDFHNGTIYPVLERTFDRQNVPLHHVILEVTESVYMDDEAGVVRQTLAALRDRGLQIALDDFGTGYASLTHLMDVPVDYIKIDKSFVDRIASHPPSRAIVEGLVTIASKMGIGLVAEGIETFEQARQLVAIGCTMGQGYFYSPALDAGSIGSMLIERAEGMTAQAKAREAGAL